MVFDLFFLLRDSENDPTVSFDKIDKKFVNIAPLFNFS